jgi:hypothetical protein
MKKQTTGNYSELGSKSDDREKEKKEEYKKGYNACLKDLGKTGEKWQHLYL